MKKQKPINIGDQVRVIHTGQKVTIEQISEHGFAVVKFNSGGQHLFLNHKLEKISEGSRLLQ